MKTNRISCVHAKALKRPPGYLEDVKVHSSIWDEKTGVYQMTDENWSKMKLKWTPKNEQPNPKDRCQYRTCGGCAGGPQCTAKGTDCPYNTGTYEQCDTWNKINKTNPLIINTNKPEQCKFASCGCGKKPIKCNQLGNLGNICPNPHDKECEYRSGSEAKPLPFFSKRKAICNECILDKIKCPIVHEEGCAINRILNDPKHECPHKAWNREPDYIFYTLNGFKVNETDYKLKKEKS